jgi:hypothetical protein
MRKIAAGFFIAGLFTLSCNKNQNLTSGCINFQSYLKVPWVIMAGSVFNLQVSACKLNSSAVTMLLPAPPVLCMIERQVASFF